MKKMSFVINIAIIVSILYLLYCLIAHCFVANNYFLQISKYGNVEGYDIQSMTSTAIEFMIYAVIEAVLIVLLGVSIFLFNYRFDGVSMREKVAKRLAESAEKRKVFLAEKKEADKQKRLEKLQAEVDELKRE